MTEVQFNGIESHFADTDKSARHARNFPYIVVENFPLLGFLTSLRFLEWVIEHPEGSICLPTGKTPEYFIVWTAFLLEHWNDRKGKPILEQYGMDKIPKPDLRNLRFIQIDEFYPISPKQHNSFCNFVRKYYLGGFGIDPARALLIDCDNISLPLGKHFSEVFPDLSIDLSLRYREPASKEEQLRQQSIFAIDNWCTGYESQIREMGGIGFFLGGIGPDGHIAFNTKGSDHHSVTRLTTTNFETQAVAASDLGGIEISRNRMVITIGLETITFNPETVAILFAAGDAKASVVRDALEKLPSNLYPASALYKLKHARFYLTRGAASMLSESVDEYYFNGKWNREKTDRALTDLCLRLDKYAHHITPGDLANDIYCKPIAQKNNSTVDSVVKSVIKKIDRGMKETGNQVYLHTGPHHDDIMLGMLPYIHRLLRNETNKAHFAILTSGFTAVTNRFMLKTLNKTKQFLDAGLIQMTNYPDFFNSGYQYKWDKDVYHYLIKVAAGEPYELSRGLSHRMVRAIVEIYKVKNVGELRSRIVLLIGLLENSYDGERNPGDLQLLKGMIREFEEELVWARFGIEIKNIHHLRLGFYTGEIFSEQPDRNRDVKPFLELLRKINPSMISLAFDPEGSGPDTHYKVLQVIAEAIRIWKTEHDLSGLRIWGYRNVWYRFHPAEVNVIVPVSLNAMAVMRNAFANSYLSQVEASFPSYQYDGKFSELTQKIWVDQLKTVQLLLGKDYFYQHASPRIRASHGMLFFKEMRVEEFLTHARRLEESTEGFSGRLYS